MPKKTYTPAPDSLAARVCAWFRLNSEEELTAGDIATKFDVPRTSVHNSLAAALSHEVVLYARSADEGSGGGMYYRAGPNLGACEPAVATSRRGKAALPALDCSAIEVEEGVTPPLKGGRPRTDWTPLLQRLVGVSATKPIPKGYQHSAAKALKAWRDAHGGEYALRSDGTDHFRIYRTA